MTYVAYLAEESASLKNLLSLSLVYSIYQLLLLHVQSRHSRLLPFIFLYRIQSRGRVALAEFV